MVKINLLLLFVVMMVITLSGCASVAGTTIAVETNSSLPGVTVTLHGEPQQLSGTPLTVGSRLPESYLVDSITLKKIDISQLKGKVLFLSLVPSLENTSQMKGKILHSKLMPSLESRFCETQTQYLGEHGDDLPPDVLRITISSDSPLDQKRFADRAKYDGITYLSDYSSSSFGRSTGLLVTDRKYIARAVILVDKEGIVRYLQVVPELTHLPDMKRAFSIARKLAETNEIRAKTPRAVTSSLSTVPL